ncbi:MAG: hypothetical protein NVS2B1_03600 [Bradyrhizobium sp.]
MAQQPPAPISDATLANAPPYILVEERWDDVEWREAAATRDGERTPHQSYVFAGGPRAHPWGPNAYQADLGDGKMAWFPNEAAFHAHMTGAAAADTEAAGRTALDQLNRSLAAAGKPA